MARTRVSRRLNGPGVAAAVFAVLGLAASAAGDVWLRTRGDNREEGIPRLDPRATPGRIEIAGVQIKGAPLAQGTKHLYLHLPPQPPKPEAEVREAGSAYLMRPFSDHLEPNWEHAAFQWPDDVIREAGVPLQRLRVTARDDKGVYHPGRLAAEPAVAFDPVYQFHLVSRGGFRANATIERLERGAWEPLAELAALDEPRSGPVALEWDANGEPRGLYRMRLRGRLSPRPGVDREDLEVDLRVRFVHYGDGPP